MVCPIHVVDAFATRRFSGNPAAVVLLDEYPADETLQAIAAENNLAETAFPIRRPDGKWDLRWFTPGAEVPLCGHATLASAFVLFEHVIPKVTKIVFVTRSSGELIVHRCEDGALCMDFPANRSVPVALDLGEVITDPPLEVRQADGFLMAVLPTAEAVENFVPDRAAILDLPERLIITAPGDKGYDCVSRFFAPHIAIDEDPVTGGAHCVIAPYWAELLGKSDIRAWQASARGGELLCRIAGDRVELRGGCVPYLSGQIKF
jgi:PhzF family phenazine biosynthesis protein